MVPESLRAELLKDLHSTHLGASKMKAVARQYFWWPSLDKMIEELSGSCKFCLEVRPEQAEAILTKWPTSQSVFERVHMDYAGPFKGRMLARDFRGC